jgi:molybdate transport system ATP-binding protein
VIEAQLQLKRAGFLLDVTLALPSQGVTALFGPSGCGKTSLLRALAGLDRAAGRVCIDGEVWQDDASHRFVPTHRRPLGYVIQEAALFPHLSVQGNLDYARRRSTDAVALDAVIELLGLAPLLSRRPESLSGGERQRVAIARALASAPRLLLMDEPLAALDAARKAEILPYLEDLHRELALPIVYVTHAMDEAARLAQHLVLMDAGRVQAAGPLTELMSRGDLPLARPDDAGVVVEATVTALDSDYGLAQLGFAGHTLWVGASRAQPGQRVRARVLARDVSVTSEAPGRTSILNILPVVLEHIHADGTTVLLRLAVPDAAGGAAPAYLLARITRKSCDALALQPGQALYAQIKGVALM